MFEYALLLVFPALVAFGGAYDLLTMTIPNRISLALVALFLVAAPVVGLPTPAILMHVATGLAMLAVGIALFAFGGFGGGDAKLLAAAALWIGFDQLLPFVVYVAFFGGVLAMAILFYRRMPVLGIHAPEWAMHLHRRDTGIPYGIAIASSALLVYPHSAWFAAALA